MRFDYGVSPNVVTYTSAMQACAVRGKWKEALALLHEMTAAAAEVTRNHLNQDHYSRHRDSALAPGGVSPVHNETPNASASSRIKPTEEFRRSTSRARRAAAAAAVKPNDRTFGAAFRAAAEAGTSAPVRELLAQWFAAHDYELQLGGPKQRAQRMRDAAGIGTAAAGAANKKSTDSSAGTSSNVDKPTEATSRDSRSVAVYGGLGGSDAAFTWVYALRACIAANDWATALHVLESYRARRSLQRWGSRTGVAMLSSKKSGSESSNNSSEVAFSRSSDLGHQDGYGPEQSMYRSMDELWCDECDAALLACANALRDDDDDGFISDTGAFDIDYSSPENTTNSDNMKSIRNSCAQELAALTNELQRHAHFAAWPQTAQVVDIALGHSRANPGFGGHEWRLRRNSPAKAVNSSRPFEMPTRDRLGTAAAAAGSILQDSTLMSEFQRAVDRPNNFVK
jgi:pentatricopeptide repeat protein